MGEQRAQANILVVDDDRATREALAMLLSGPEQHVVTADSGTDALRRCLQTDFAVVLLDLRMPDMDGYEAATHIHARPRSSGTPILFLTGDAGELERLRGYEVGAVDFLLKPVEPLVLRAKVRVFVELWRQRQEILAAQLRLRELEAREAQRQAEEAALAERRRADARLHELLERQALVFASVPVAIFTRARDEPRRVTWTSENVEAVLGCSPAAFAADPDLWREHVHPDDRPAVLRELGTVTRGDPASFTYRWRAPDGSWRWILEHVSVPRDDAGHRDLHGTWVDIHDQKRMEEALRQANEALDRRVAERTSELAAALEELESFSYSVSHDLRAPLRSIHGYSRILAEATAATLTPEAEQAQARVAAAVNRMGQLIDDLLRLSRVARVPLERERVDLSALAADVVSVLRERDPDRKTDVVIAPGLLVDADRGLLRIALENLLENAWKFSRGAAAPRIEVGARADDPTVFYVRDNGVGFDMRYAHQLFRPFHRLHTDAFAGTGIGLATVRRIVQRHGGDVWPESAPGAGATFYFTVAPSPGGNVFRP